MKDFLVILLYDWQWLNFILSHLLFSSEAKTTHEGTVWKLL